MKKLALFLVLACALTSCKKVLESILDNKAPVDASGFTQYTIPAGSHYCNGNSYRAVETASQFFTVRFDSSAIYQSADPVNQYDINKLWGFSDNNGDHHAYSARFSWRWSEGALRLFGYVYNNGSMQEQELTTIPIGAEVRCGIQVEAKTYRFVVNGQSWTLPRQATTALGKGYQLYPYFGGDEPAPHEVRIWIKAG